MTETVNTKCPTCSASVNRDKLRNRISQREFDISGMCQKCQDSVFGPS